MACDGKATGKLPEWFKELEPGKQVIEIRNNGRQAHELVLVKLVPGKTSHDVIASIVKPGHRAGGRADRWRDTDVDR